MVIKLVDETDLKRSINNEVVYRFTLTIYKKVAYVGGVSTSSGVVILQKPSV